ncbi:hypothetical protein LINPERHAP1_LOCUS20748 [Linum perenne]
MTVWSSATPYPDPMIYMFPNKPDIGLLKRSSTCDMPKQETQSSGLWGEYTMFSVYYTISFAERLVRMCKKDFTDKKTTKKVWRTAMRLHSCMLRLWSKTYIDENAATMFTFTFANVKCCNPS